MAEKAADGRILAFDGLRGMAALAVVCLHMTSGVIAYNGFLAVDMFFLLSGFVVAGAYEDRLSEGAGPLWFFSKRMARLYPLYAFGLVLGAVALLHTPATLMRGALFNVFFLPDPFRADAVPFPLDAPAWSLSAEVAVNLLYAWGGYRLGNRALAAVVGLAAAALVALAFVISPAELGWRQSWLDLAGCAARVLFGFPLGVLLFRLHRAGRLPRITRVAILPLAASGLLFFLEWPWWSWLDTLLIVVVMPFLFLALLGADRTPGPLDGVYAWLGRLSYPLYIVHVPVIRLFSTLKAPATVGAWLMQVPRLAPLVLLVALAAMLWVEPLGRRWVTRALTPAPA
jgi:peptidoglycan/LPS O-acetylase OafA/YrhL